MGGWPAEFEALIRAHCTNLTGDAPIDGDALLTSLGMDSLEVVEFIVAIEDTFDLSLPPEVLTPQVFATPHSVWEAIDGLCRGRAEDRRAAPASAGR